MSQATVPSRRGPWLTPARKRIIGLIFVVALLVAMVLDTKFVPKGSKIGQGPAAFNAADYGKKQFPIQQRFISSHAVDATVRAAAIKKDPTAAGKKYGVEVNQGATTVVPVKFTGVVGKVPAAGYAPVKVAGLPHGTKIAVQLGPAITGTDLRDATGKIQLGQFENQIQYQDAGSAINDQLKIVLKKAGAPDLQGKTISVSGVFELINPQLWNVTPATIKVDR